MTPKVQFGSGAVHPKQKSHFAEANRKKVKTPIVEFGAGARHPKSKKAAVGKIPSKSKPQVKFGGGAIHPKVQFGSGIIHPKAKRHLGRKNV